MFEALPLNSSHLPVPRTVLLFQNEAAGINRGLQSQTTGGCLISKKWFCVCMFECPRNQGRENACEDAAHQWESLSSCWNSP